MSTCWIYILHGKCTHIFFHHIYFSKARLHCHYLLSFYLWIAQFLILFLAIWSKYPISISVWSVQIFLRNEKLASCRIFHLKSWFSSKHEFVRRRWYGIYVNTKKTTLDFNLDFYQAFKQHGYTKKHGN